MADTCITLTIEKTAPGAVRLTALRSESGQSTTVERWDHTIDYERISEEARGLLRETRRSIEKGEITARQRGHGGLIFDLLFPSELKRTLRRGMGTLAIISEEIHLPWGALHDGSQHLATSWGIGRLLLGGRPHKASTEPTRTLVIADPSADLPAAHFEGEAIVRLFASANDGACDLRLGRMRRTDLLRQFSRYDILHFAGHADSVEEPEASGWRFIDGNLTSEDISRVVGNRAPRLIYANACRSATTELQRAFTDAGVGHQVVTNVDVPDLPGAEFATAFYQSLHGGCPIGVAFREAVQDAVRRHSPVWLAYELVGDPRSVFYRARLSRRLPPGQRRAGFLVTLSSVSEQEEADFALRRAQRRAALKSLIQEHGGRMLPGRSAATRAAFGVPASFENDYVRAIQAGLAIQRKLEGSTTVVGFGEVAVDGVEVEGALMHKAEALCWSLGPGVFTLENTQSALRETVELCPMEGREVSRVMGLIATGSIHYGALVGRKEPLRRMSMASASCLRSSEPRFVFVVGPAGIGKSHLIHVAGAQLGNSFRRVHGRARAYSEGTPYQPYAQVLKQLIGTAQRPAPKDVEAYLERLDSGQTETNSPIPVSIETLLSDEPERQPFLSHRAEVLTLLGDDSHAGDVEPEQLSRAFARIIGAEASRAPLAILLSDLHWLPDTGHSILEEIITTQVSGTLLIVVSARPGVVEALDRWSNHEGAERIDLGPLSRQAADELVRQTAPMSSPQDIKGVISRAEGNPLYLRELALASREAEPLPGTIEGVIRARFDRLELPLKETLQAGAIWGRAFNLHGVGILLNEPADLLSRLSSLEHGRFIHRGQSNERTPKWRFDHALLHEVIYQATSSQTRRAWHAKAAAWLRTHKDTTQVATLLRIARHHQNAEDSRRAASTWLECGRRAAQLVMPAEALEALKESVGIEERHPGSLSQDAYAEAQAELGKLLFEAGDLSGADLALAQAIALTVPSQVVIRSERMFDRARVLEAQGQIAVADEAVSTARRALKGELVPEARKLDLELRRYGAWLTYRSGDIKAASKTFRELVDEVPEDQLLLKGLALNGAGVAEYGLGDYSAAHTYFRRALDKFEEVGSHRRRCSAYNNLGMVCAKGGDAREAIKWYERAVNLHAKASNRTGLAQTYNNIGTLYGDLGDLEKAEGFFRESVRIREASGHSGLAIGYANLSEVLFKLAHLEDALGYVTSAIDLCEKGRGPQYLLPDAYRMLSEMQLAKGTVDVSIISGEKALNLAERASDVPRKAAAHRALGQAYSAAQKPHEAEQHLTESITILEELDQPFELARAYEAKAAHLDAVSPGSGEALRAQADRLREDLAL